ncbi:MAG: hypothetical protein ACRCXC_07280 [Legionella sp.]
MQYQYGEQFSATITLQDNENIYSISDINASLTCPNNQSIPLKIEELKRNQFKASAFIHSEENTNGDGWYIDV